MDDDPKLSILKDGVVDVCPASHSGIKITKKAAPRVRPCLVGEFTFLLVSL